MNNKEKREKVLDKYTKLELATIIADTLDGSSAWYEIQQNTGLRDDRCKEISKAANELICVVYLK